MSRIGQIVNWQVDPPSYGDAATFDVAVTSKSNTTTSESVSTGPQGGQIPPLRRL